MLALCRVVADPNLSLAPEVMPDARGGAGCPRGKVLQLWLMKSFFRLSLATWPINYDH